MTEHFLIARSTFYRWLHAAERGDLGEKKTSQESPRKTPAELAGMIWDVFEANPYFGRQHIANILWLLGVFVAASTVRNVLLQPKPRSAPAAAKAKATSAAPREIVARYPNHVWSVDRTRVLRWGLWPTWVLVAIDHYSRAVVAVVPLEGPNAGWVVGAMEDAFAQQARPGTSSATRKESSSATRSGTCSSGGMPSNASVPSASMVPWRSPNA